MSEKHDCSRCMKCVRECPEKALTFDEDEEIYMINTGRCLRTACNRCQDNCPEKCFDYSKFTII